MAQMIVGSDFPDSASEQLKPSKVNYGANQFRGASSDLPNERTRADLTVNNDGDDAVLDRLTREGHHDNSGTDEPVQDLQRKVDISQYPATFGMKDPNANNPKVPSGPADSGDVLGLKRDMGFE